MSRLLSPHFDLAEFCTSQTAARLGIQMYPPPPEVVRNLERLCFELLEPIRMVVERPIIINSGWRPDWLNKAVGGSENSAHLYGRAADIVCPGMVPLGVAGRIGMMYATYIEKPGVLLTSNPPQREHVSMLESLDQCILEFGQWVHVAIAEEKPRGEFLTARRMNGHTVYEVGLRP